MNWFRPAIPCEDAWELWGNVWDWIGLAHFEQWYPEVDRVRRYQESYSYRSEKKHRE